MNITAINPATGQIIQQYTRHTKEQIKETIDDCHKTWITYKETSFSERSRFMNKAAEILRKEKEKFAQLITAEMGKPISESRSEVEKCAWVCNYYADNAAEFLKDETIKTDATKSYVSYQPLGVVLAVMPWNYPFWQVFRFAAPALMAGNVGILKHASNVPGCALAIEQVFQEAGFPNNAFKSLLINSDQVTQIIEHKWVKAATLTGSEPAGRAVAEQAGKHIKKTVLELGGSDPYIVLHDADIEQAAKVCADSRLLNSGQSCIAAKRMIVVEDVYDEFLQAFSKNLKERKVGLPTKEDTDVGPMARTDLRDELHEQVQEAIKQGATCMFGGKIPDGEGAFYPVSLLTDVQPGNIAFEEELFGPVASVVRASNEEEAIELANATRFGLGAAVFTKDEARGEAIARNQLAAGCCFVNHLVASDPRLPFGGINASGYGRELSHFGIREFVNIKTVSVK